MTRTPDAAVPRWLLVPASAALALVAVPLIGLMVRVPWAQIPRLLATPAAQDALWLSLRTCAASTVLSLTLGLPLAVVLSRLTGRWAAVVRTVSVLPMVLPPVVAGLVLLITLGRRGVLGQYLSVWGIDIGFTTAAVVIAQTFVSMPYLVITVEGALRSTDRGLEMVAATLGARPTTVLRRVTLPLVGPAILGGTTVAFARALGEFGATLTFAGSLQGTTRTLPLQIYLQRETDTNQALALSVVLIAVASVLMVAPTLVGRRAR